MRQARCISSKILTFPDYSCENVIIEAFDPDVMGAKFSTSDLTILRLRCPKCAQYTDKIVTVLVRKEAVPCVSCGARISLSTPTNKILIAETAASCARIGETLMKGLGLEAVLTPGGTPNSRLVNVQTNSLIGRKSSARSPNSNIENH